MSRFRFLESSYDFGFMRCLSIAGGRERRGVRFVLRPERGKRLHYMRMKLMAQKQLRSWMQDSQSRTMDRLKRGMRA